MKWLGGSTCLTSVKLHVVACVSNEVVMEGTLAETCQYLRPPQHMADTNHTVINATYIVYTSLDTSSV